MHKGATKLSYWWLAVKPASLVKIAVPALVGVCMGYAQTRVVDIGLLGCILIFVLAAQLAIVLLNDYADREADAVHAETFPQLIDPRVIPQRLIGKNKILLAGGGAALAALGSGGGMGVLYGREYGAYLATAGLLVFWLYSFPPVKLNYRGGGELLEAAGVGGILPLAGFYFYSGVLGDYPVYLTLPMLCYSLVSAMASGLKHEPADRHSGKKTACVLWGSVAVGWTILVLQGMAAGISVLGYILGWYGLPMLALGGIVPLLMAWINCGKRSDYRDLTRLGVYKKGLSRAAYMTSLGLVLHFLLFT